ncbi:hypothetical protein [Paenibacillus sp. ov031]|uniref:hypothetical protein n=1 Tax=Paenibacillus sp. ov031 TaxID=1761879 RepID=UPI000932AB8C|nr:hypothetical protein [Paenibacillus sp. ov031]
MSKIILVSPFSNISKHYSDLLKNNSIYNQFSSDRNHYFKQLHELLPQDMHKTLFLYDDADLSVQTILEREIYLQGFKDALQLHNELNITSN